MKTKRICTSMLVVILVSLLCLSGCISTDVASAKTPQWDKKPIAISGRDYTILGNVQLEKKWFGVLGFSISRLGINAFVFQNGGVTYADLLEEAKKQYPEADAVIDVIVDYSGSIYAFLYAQKQNIVTGIAVKYVKEPERK